MKTIIVDGKQVFGEEFKKYEKMANSPKNEIIGKPKNIRIFDYAMTEPELEALMLYDIAKGDTVRYIDRFDIGERFIVCDIDDCSFGVERISDGEYFQGNGFTERVYKK